MTTVGYTVSELLFLCSMQVVSRHALSDYGMPLFPFIPIDNLAIPYY